MGVPEEERSKAESMFKKIMAGNFLNQGKKQDSPHCPGSSESLKKVES